MVLFTLLLQRKRTELFFFISLSVKVSSKILFFTVFPKWKKVKKGISLLEGTAERFDQQLQLDFNGLGLLIDLKWEFPAGICVLLELWQIMTYTYNYLYFFLFDICISRVSILSERLPVILWPDEISNSANACDLNSRSSHPAQQDSPASFPS